MTQADLLNRLTLPGGRLRMVLDTDAYNEVDDQFAIVYALRSPERLQVEAIYAAPFLNERSVSAGDGMEQSYAEIHKLLSLMEYPAPEGFVKRGSKTFLPDRDTPVVSDAARDLVDRAMSSDEPLYVVAIGAITNVASALLLEPAIAERIVVVWLGGHALNWPDTREFNLMGDLPAAQVLFDSGVPLVLLPVLGVINALSTTPAELDRFVDGKSAVGSYLAKNVRDAFPENTVGSRVIWDIATIAYLRDEAFTPTQILPRPILTDNGTYSFDASRSLMKYVYFVHRDAIFADLFPRLY